MCFLQVDDLRVVKNRFYNVDIELAENRMVVMQAQMADIDLDRFTFLFNIASCRARCRRPLGPAKFLSDLEESLFDFLFNSRTQLLLLVVKFEVLPFEVLERLTFRVNSVLISGPDRTQFHVLLNRLLTYSFLHAIHMHRQARICLLSLHLQLCRRRLRFSTFPFLALLDRRWFIWPLVW